MKKRIELKHLNEEGHRVYDCPICATGDVVVKDNSFYGKCNNCSMTMIDYQPLSHQDAFHESTAQYRLNIGGFGSGKTTAACAEIAIHAMDTPNGRSLITAPTLSLVKDAVIPELNKFIPPWHIETSRLNPSPFYKLKNGHEILVYSAADQQKLRSLNLTAFYIEEASGVDFEIFDQLMTRLRSKAGVIRDKNGNEIDYKYMGIVSTNPEDGWILDNFMLISDKLVASPSIDVSMYGKFMRNERNKHFHTFISSTRDNEHVPREFIERMSAGKSERWIRKYVDCYIDISEDAVYPEFSKCLVEPFPVPQHWKRIAGFDPGYADGVAFVQAAIRPSDGKIFVYGDYFVKEMPVSHHAQQIKRLVKGLEFLYAIQADPSVNNRSDRDGLSYKDYFYKLSGVSLAQANNDIMYGIEKVRDYMVSGNLFFFNDLEHIKFEAKSYQFRKSERRNSNETPIDKNNHLMDAMRYMIAKLPQDPNDMVSVYVNNYLEVPVSNFVQSFDSNKNEAVQYGGKSIYRGLKKF
jgi:PBSX family phage terminase large subunit